MSTKFDYQAALGELSDMYADRIIGQHEFDDALLMLLYYVEGE